MKKETKSTLLIPESNVSFDTYESRKSALLLRAVNNKVRHKIINILYNYEKENKNYEFRKFQKNIGQCYEKLSD